MPHPEAGKDGLGASRRRECNARRAPRRHATPGERQRPRGPSGATDYSPRCKPGGQACNGGRTPEEWHEGAAKHHGKRTFREDFLAMLAKHGIDCPTEHLWG